MVFDANFSLKRMVRPLFLVENHSRIERSQLSHVAGFVAIFIEASYLSAEGSNASFYRGICHIMLQHLAVYITLTDYEFTSTRMLFSGATRNARHFAVSNCR